MPFLKFHMLYLLASDAVWMLFGSDTLTADARLYTNLAVLLALLHSFWLLVTLLRQQMATWYATTECGAGPRCVAAKGQVSTVQTPVVLKVSEDSDVHRNNMLGWAEFLHPPPQSADRLERGGGFMEGRQGGDLDPCTGRDTQVTEAGGAFYLLINSLSLSKQLWNARSGERERRGCENRWSWRQSGSLSNVWVHHL